MQRMRQIEELTAMHLERLAEAEAPFWAHVREAILASQQERVA